MSEAAILMAAGLGTRMRPLTEKLPKPLIKVNGVPMIETVIDALRSRGTGDIFIVAGYLKECFFEYASSHPGLQIVENAEYETKNNISSIHAVCDMLGQSDVFICEADLYVRDPGIFKKTPDHSCYFGKMVSGYSDDWVFETGSDGYISRVGRGGTDCYNMVGISYFKQPDAAILKDAILKAFDREDHGKLFWDEVVDSNLDRLKLMIRPVDANSIVEIDTCEELRAVEEAVKNAG